MTTELIREARALVAAWDKDGAKVTDLIRPIEDLRAALSAVEAQQPVATLISAAVDCPHDITDQRVVLRYDSSRLGHNALNQLGLRLESALASPAASVQAQSGVSEAQEMTDERAEFETWAVAQGLRLVDWPSTSNSWRGWRQVRALAAAPQVMLNGLTEEETSATASVLGLTQRASSAEGAVSSPEARDA